MVTGTVKFFNTTKGYGFIEPEDGSKDAFVHISAVERAGLGTLREGQKVSYDLVADRKGGLYFTDPILNPAQVKAPPGRTPAVFYLRPDGELVMVT